MHLAGGRGRLTFETRLRDVNKTVKRVISIQSIESSLDGLSVSSLSHVTEAHRCHTRKKKKRTSVSRYDVKMITK